MRNSAFGNRTCLDAQGGKKGLRKPVSLYGCHRQGGNQVNNRKCLLNASDKFSSKNCVVLSCYIRVLCNDYNLFFGVFNAISLHLQFKISVQHGHVLLFAGTNLLLSAPYIILRQQFITNIKACTTSFSLNSQDILYRNT